MANKNTLEPLTQAQSNEFTLNRLGYYCRVRTVWNQSRKKSDFKFEIIRYNNDQEVSVYKDNLLHSCGEIEAMKERNKFIEGYLKKVEK